MTQAFQATATIDRPVDQVWSELIDWPRAAEWMSGVDSVRAGGDTAVGTKLTVHARGKDRTSTITALEPGRSITLTSVQGGVTADYQYTCESQSGGTLVTLVADVRTAGIWKLFGGFIRSAIKKADSGQLDALKRAVEARGHHV